MMSDEELEVIRGRLNAAEYSPHASNEVAALLAEVERLRKQEAELRHTLGLKDALLAGLTARVAAQSELLARAATRTAAGTTPPAPSGP